jgi:hypothetical protein
MPSVVKRTLIFFALLVAGLVLYVQWFSIQADNYDKTVVPYLDAALPKLTSWQYTELRPLLSPQAQLEYDSAQGQATYQLLSKLGALEAAGKPAYLGDHSASSAGLGDIQLVTYQVPLEFESGPALIKFKLAIDARQQYFIHQFGIQSEIFAATANTD